MSDPGRRDEAPGCWCVLAAVAGWFLWQEHRVHLLGALPYVLLLACPLMHGFMHRRHDGHRHGADGEGPGDSPPPRSSREEGR